MARGDEGERLLKNGYYPCRKQNRLGERVRKNYIQMLQNRREVSFAEGAAFAQKYGIKFFETSAKTAQNVEEAFLSTANIILDNIERGEYDLSNEV